MDSEKCVCCGSVIPEGRQVCPSCENDNKITNPVKAIRAYCLECSCGQTSEIKDCPVIKCPLYPFRFGKNPYRQRREMTEEQKQVLADRLREARKKPCWLCGKIGDRVCQQLVAILYSSALLACSLLRKLQLFPVLRC